MTKWICQCNAVNVQFSGRCHQCGRPPAGCGSAVGDARYPTRSGSACQSCRGYYLERQWCTHCGGSGRVYRYATPDNTTGDQINLITARAELVAAAANARAAHSAGKGEV